MECCIKKMNAKLEDFTLHRNALLLLDGVQSYNFTEKKIEAFTHIDEKNIFYEKKVHGAYSYIGFEFAAQAVSVYVGLEAHFVKQSKPTMGFIISLSKLQCYKPAFCAEKLIVIQASETHRDANIAYFDGVVNQEGTKIMEVSFMAMLADFEHKNGENYVPTRK